MNDLAITRAVPDDLQRLLEVWESSVRATHDFLPEGEIHRSPLGGQGYPYPILHLLREGMVIQ